MIIIFFLYHITNIETHLPLGGLLVIFCDQLFYIRRTQCLLNMFVFEIIFSSIRWQQFFSNFEHIYFSKSASLRYVCVHFFYFLLYSENKRFTIVYAYNMTRMKKTRTLLRIVLVKK